MQTKANYDFKAKRAQYRKYSNDQLRWARQDAIETAKIQDDWNPVGACWYLDDASTIGAELKRRGQI